MPCTITLPATFSVTLEPAVGLLRSLNKQGYRAEHQFLANLRRPIFGEAVTTAAEIAAEYTMDRNIPARYIINPSLHRLPTPTLQIDVGAYIGLNKGISDCNTRRPIH